MELTVNLTDKQRIALAEFINQAPAAGMPRDQVERFLSAGYIPLPAMLPFHAACREADRYGGPDEIALGGTRAPGKSHAAFAQVSLDDCQRFPGLKILYLRKVKLSASEAFEDLVRKVLRYTEHTYKEGRVTFPNGSRILIGGFNNESDIDKYLGVEYDQVVPEEATQLSLLKVEKISGSCRSTMPNYRARKIYTANPDGIGLAWFKARFVIPWRHGTERFTKFFHRTYQDNPYVSDEYKRYLDGLTGALRKAWRDGDWDAFEGMAFPNFSELIHRVQPFEIPEHWPRWTATDYGYNKPWSTHWYARNPDTRQIVVYREAYQTLLTSTQQANTIQDLTPPSEQVQLHYADPAMWTRTNARGIVSCAADDYRDAGVPLTPGDNDRINGKRKVDQMLAIQQNGEPGVVIFSTCPHLLEQIASLPFDKTHPEDVDTDVEDHAYDDFRYGLTNVKLAAPPPKTEAERRQTNPLARIGVL
jgi:hypothetical protein